MLNMTQVTGGQLDYREEWERRENSDMINNPRVKSRFRLDLTLSLFRGHVNNQ